MVHENRRQISLPIMLAGDVLNFYFTLLKDLKVYDDEVSQMQSWYTRNGKIACILTAWKTMTLSKAMDEGPTSSDVSVLRKFLSRLMSQQMRLYKTYHSDIFLRDILLTAVDETSMKTNLRDRMPRSSHQAVNRVITILSEVPNLAGSASACIIDASDEHEAAVNY